MIASTQRFQSEVAQFSAISETSPVPHFRHPGLDPGSRFSTSPSGTPDQVRGDEERKTSIANEVAQFSGLSL